MLKLAVPYTASIFEVAEDDERLSILSVKRARPEGRKGGGTETDCDTAGTQQQLKAP